MKTLITIIAALVVGALVGVYALAPMWQPGSQARQEVATEQSAAPAADAEGAPVR